MKDIDKTKEQLLQELAELRKRNADLKAQENERKHSEEKLRESEEKFRLLAEKSPNMIFINKAGRVTYANEKCEEIMGYKREELYSQDFDFLTLIAPESISLVEANFKKHMEGEEISPCVYTLITKHGRKIDAIHSTTLINFEGETAILGIITDVTDRKCMEEKLKASEEKYRSLVESTDDSIYLVDRDYRYLFMNKKHLSRMSLSDDQYLGKAYSEFHSPEETKVFIEKINKVLTTGESIRDEYRSQKDGKYFLQTFSPVKSPEGKTIAVNVVSKNITERKQMEDKLRSLSLTDELTGLFNRRGFMTLAKHQLKMAKRLSRGIFMLYADMDNLKGINDTFGHREGDLALIETANILKNNYRESDIIARFGGDEFVVIPVGTSKDNIEIITTRFHKTLAIHNAKGNRKYKLSISIGIAYYDPEFPCSVDELLKQADKMMYQEKRRKQKTQF